MMPRLARDGSSDIFLRSWIRKICGNGNVFAAEMQAINDLLDMNFIKQQVAASSFDYADCIRLVEGIVGILCSIQDRMAPKPSQQQGLPVAGCHAKLMKTASGSRSAPARIGTSMETRAKWADVLAGLQSAKDKGQCAQAFCRSLEFCLDCIHAVRMDVASEKLRAIAPVIATHGVEYLRSHFLKKFGPNATLDGTKAWIAAAVRTALAQKLVSLDGFSRSLALAYETVLCVGFVDLISSSPATFPETMLLEKGRIEGALRRLFGMHVSCVVAMASVDHLVSQNLRLPNADRILGGLRSAYHARLQLLHEPGGGEELLPLQTLRRTLLEHCDESLVSVAETVVTANLREDSRVHELLVRAARLGDFATCLSLH